MAVRRAADKSKAKNRGLAEVAGLELGSSLASEIEELREALREAKRRMQSGEEDMAKMGLLIARLSDSLGRALLAQERLAGSGDRSTWLRAETDRLLREMGLGEGKF